MVRRGSSAGVGKMGKGPFPGVLYCISACEYARHGSRIMDRARNCSDYAVGSAVNL